MVEVGGRIRPYEPKRTDDTNKLHELRGECLECSGGAAKEFVPLILFFFFFLSFFFQCRVVITAEEGRTPQSKRSGGRGLRGGAPTKRDCLVRFSVSTAGAFVGGGRGVRWCGGQVRLAKGWRRQSGGHVGAIL